MAAARVLTPTRIVSGSSPWPPRCSHFIRGKLRFRKSLALKDHKLPSHFPSWVLSFLIVNRGPDGACLEAHGKGSGTYGDAVSAGLVWSERSVRAPVSLSLFSQVLGWPFPAAVRWPQQRPSSLWWGAWPTPPHFHRANPWPSGLT